jgi:hypothetical protein
MEMSKSECGKAAKRYELICGRIFAKVLMVGLPLLLLDYISPYLWFHRQPKILRRFPVQVVRQPKPYTMFGGVKNGILGDNTELNELGYRGKEPRMPKASEEYRIFVLGGSTVFVGEPPIPVLLEGEFRRNGKDNVHVYNFGIVSSASTMELVRILLEISELQPDLIVMYNGGNDIFTPYKYDPRPGYPFNFIVYENNPVLESDVRSYPTFSLFLYGSNLARCFLSRLFMDSFIPMEEERQKVGWCSEDWRDEIAQRYVGNLIKAEKVSNAFGSEFIAFLQPMVAYKDQQSDEEREYRPDPTFKEHCIDVRRMILQKTSAHSEGPGPILVDLTDIYDGTPASVFIDYVHTVQESKDLVVKAIYQNITGNFEIE